MQQQPWILANGKLMSQQSSCIRIGALDSIPQLARSSRRWSSNCPFSVATAIAAAILMFFLVLGQVLLEQLSISLDAFQIAGGIVLFLFALTMIFGDSKPDEEKKQIQGNVAHLAVFPLAVPSLASPGAMLSVVMLTDNHRFSIEEQVITALVMLSIILITLILFSKKL